MSTVEQLRAAADAGDAAAALELATLELEGQLIPRDLVAARRHFQRAGELGSDVGQNVFIAFLANGIGGEPDWAGAVDLLRTMAGDPRAARQLELLAGMELTDTGFPVRVAQGDMLCERPQAWTFSKLFSAAECAYLIDAADPLLQPSVIVDPSTGQLRPHPVRTSDGAAFPWALEDLVISALNRRIAAATRTDLSQGEPLQVLRYAPGQEYRPHFDALPAGANQRVLTMLVYLNEGYAGGETAFTRQGTTFAGRTGDALLFRNALDDGTPDIESQHAGLPVRAGEKFIATRWIREKPLIPA
jgi:prolyl 4-hydroxylase